MTLYLFVYLFFYIIGILAVVSDEELIDELSFLPRERVIMSVLFVNIPLLITFTCFNYWIKSLFRFLIFHYVFWKIKREVRKKGIPYEEYFEDTKKPD